MAMMNGILPSSRDNYMYSKCNASTAMAIIIHRKTLAGIAVLLIGASLFCLWTIQRSSWRTPRGLHATEKPSAKDDRFQNSELFKEEIVLPLHAPTTLPNSEDQDIEDATTYTYFSHSPVPLVVPGPFVNMPHLLNKPNALVPRVSIGSNRKGVPTVRRSTNSYVDICLDSLLRNLNDAEARDAVIVLMVADITNLDVADAFINELKNAFDIHIRKGTLEIIAPSPDYYPDFDKIPPTLGDSPDRMKWRTKQTLDFAYLMLYAQSKGAYYMQLEDDVVTKSGYLTTITNFLKSQKDYILVQFAELGFIAKLFSTVELASFTEFILQFYPTKPVDWLLSNYLFVKACEQATDGKDCQKNIDKSVRWYKPALFQHIGTESSLTGKVQQLKEKDFGPVELFAPHQNNPPLKRCWTSLAVPDGHSLEDAYNGKGFFWSSIPAEDDTITFELSQPLLLAFFALKSGNVEHPNDFIRDAVVESVLDVRDGEQAQWSEIGKFHRGLIELGIRDGKAFTSLRIRFTAKGSSRVLLREVGAPVSVTYQVSKITNILYLTDLDSGTYTTKLMTELLSSDNL